MSKENEITAHGVALLSLINHEDLNDRGAMLYSLIDGAKFPSLGRLTLPNDDSVTLHSLLGESAQVDAIYAGPVLLSHARGQHCPVLTKLLKQANSAHFLSLIVSDEPFPTLFERLRWLTDVVHDDGTEWVMRYYDPLVLPHWLGVLDRAQRATALGGSRAWVYIDMHGRPHSVGSEKIGDAVAIPSDPMLLSQQQCDELMSKTLPYMVMHQLESDDPQLLSTLSPRDRYAFFSQQLCKASAYGLSSPADLKCYCMLSLMIGAHFDASPVAAEALRQASSDDSFSERILSWTPEQWAALEESESIL